MDMKKPDLWLLPLKYRGSVYRHMQQSLENEITTKMRATAGEYKSASRVGKSCLLQEDSQSLRRAKDFILQMLCWGNVLIAPL